MAKQAIEAPAPRPPRFGLIASAPTIDNQDRWQEGFKFAPENCGSSGRVSVGCRGNTDTLDSDTGPTTVEGDPFVVYSWDECSTFGFLARDYQGRARRQLLATRSFQMADELWSGTLRDADTLANRVLTDPESDVLTNGAASEVSALACVDSAVLTASQGRQGMVHMTPQLLVHLKNMNVVQLEGTTWTTPNGNIIVPDAGYDGSGPVTGGVPTPAGDSQWIYGTGLIYLRMADIEILPGDFAQAVDRSTNLVTFYAQQLVAYEWDECVHFAAEVDVPLCLVGGVS